MTENTDTKNITTTDSTVDKNADKNAVNIDDQFKRLETFISRRFDEISTEINATSQLIDMNDEVLKEKFLEVIQVLDAVSSYESGTTSSNSGYELDAVVNETEKATNDIMDAADRIYKYLKKREDWDNEIKREDLLERARQDIDIIIMSCSFQDLTGQRIHNAVHKIKEAEERLAKILGDLGMKVDPVETLSQELSTVTTQQDIDALFSAAREGNLE